MRAGVIASRMVVIGTDAGLNYNGQYGCSVFVGWNAGRNVTTGGSNTFIGTEVGKCTTTGGANTAMGLKALYYNTTGS